MSKKHDDLIRPDAWAGLTMGNHALARAMLEAGVRVATTYPGSPTPEVAAALDAVPPDARRYYFEYSTNEKVAVEVAAGASLNGHLSVCFFKSVGLNVAMDSLIQLPLMELIGGMVVILGDDPGVNSSQNEQDNRHFARMAFTPLFEPASPQETRDMFIEAAELARKLKTLVILRMTTHVCHAKQVVNFGALPTDMPDWTPRFAVANGPYIPIAKTVFPMKRRALAKLAQAAEHGDTTPSNAILAPCGTAPVGGKRRGVIASSLPALAVLENLEAAGQPVDLLKLGLSYPLPRRRLLDFLAAHDEVVLIEELDRLFEHELKSLAFDAGVPCRILTRRDPELLQGELIPDRTWAALGEHWPDIFAPKSALAAPAIVDRLPQLCPGCGHRSAFHAVRQAIDKDTITVADIGCHTMGFLPPYEMGQVLFSMGHSTSTAAGLAINNKSRKVLCFMGDSTFFHAAIPGVVNAVVRNHNVTMVLLENGTTAMTGHQPRAGSGEVGDKIPLVPLLQALGVKLVLDVDSYSQDKLTAAVKEAMAFDGFAVVVARHPCMLKFMRDQRAKNPAFGMAKVSIDAKCDQRKTCIKEFGCPSFVANADGSVSVNHELCIGDGSCIQTCPVHAIGRPPKGGVA